MVRKHQRVIGTLIVWIMTLIALGMMVDRMNYGHLSSMFNWFNANVVTGASSEEALRILDSVQQVSSDAYSQANHFAQTALYAYTPYFLLICALLLVGASLATMFIWRSVVVTHSLPELHRTEDESETWAEPRRSLKSLLRHEDSAMDDETPMAQQNGRD